MTKKTRLFSKYAHGVIDTKVIHSNKISKTAKVVYSLLQSRIGGLNYVQYTQAQIPKELGVSIRTVKGAFAELKKLGLVTKSKDEKKAYKLKKAMTTKGNRFGWVEYSILSDSGLTVNEKLMYSFYATVAGADTGTSNYSRDKVMNILAIGADTYVNTIKSMEEKGIIATDDGYGSKDNDYSNESTPNTYTTKRVKIFRLKDLNLYTPEKVADPFLAVEAELTDMKKFEYGQKEMRIMNSLKKVQAQNIKVQTQNAKVQAQNGKVQPQDREQTDKQVNNNKQGKAIVILDESMKRFNWLWEVYEPRGSRSSSFKSFSELDPSMYGAFQDQLEENPGTYYGLLVKEVLTNAAERKILMDKRAADKAANPAKLRKSRKPKIGHTL